jgi:hypothetical protein
VASRDVKEFCQSPDEEDDEDGEEEGALLALLPEEPAPAVLSELDDELELDESVELLEVSPALDFFPEERLSVL